MNADSIYKRGFIKIDQNGNEIWKCFTNQHSWTSSLIETKEEGLLFCEGADGSLDATLSKYSKEGILIWKIDSCGVVGELPKAIENENEEIILLERSKLEWINEFLKIKKYDKDGILIWEKELVATNIQNGTEYRTKNVYDIATFDDDNKIAIIYNSIDNDLILLILNSDGEQLNYKR